MASERWNLKTTQFGKLTLNPLRLLWERSQPPANPEKSIILLQAGDPTIFGNFPPAKEATLALEEALSKDSFSYDESAGTKAARAAVVNTIVKHSPTGEIDVKDIILTSGCSMAIETCIKALANPGENILIPRPAWNYTTWICGSGIDVQFYNLDPMNNWEIELDHMESLINDKTRAILVNTPGNPCGNVFSKEHILEILKIAERHKLPIISDEVYEFFTFPGVEFHSVASLSRNVPVLTCSGLTKRFLMPGIRMGWIIINDRGNKFEDIRLGLANIAGRNFGPNSTVQLALPAILKNVPQEFFDETVQRVGRQAKIVFDLLADVPGLRPIMPQGAMYMMIGIDHSKLKKLSTCLEFMRRLAIEHSVFVFPGECFNFSGFFRIVLTAPEDLMVESCKRMKELCIKYCEE